MTLDDDDPVWEQHSGKDLHRGPEWRDGDSARAGVFYSSISGSARLVLDALMDRPGDQVSADELAQHLQPRKPGETATSHRRAVAGSLASVSGPARESGRRLPFYWWAGAGGSPARYGMKPAVARLFRNATHKTVPSPAAGTAAIPAGSGSAAGQDDWTGPEVRATVADYLAMLAAEAAGKPYSKTEHRRALSMALNGIRSDGAIEFKHQNISAVMQELGLPYIGGYKPRGNYQAALLQEVQRQLDADPALFAVLQPASGDAVTGTALPPAPEPSAAPAGAQRDRAPGMDARALLESLTGRQIWTVTGQPNTVVGVAGDDVLVATGRSPAGQPVPVGSVQSGLDRLLEAGEIEVSTASLGHRSSFIGAVLRTLAGTVVIPATPPRIRLTDPATAYRLSEAGPISAWWAGDARQRFWLEITDRPDIGVDLHCPQRDATGSRTPGYSLIWSVEPGDVIFHYSLQKRAIIAWSRAAGQVTEAPTVWLSHRGATRRRLHEQRAQAGWWLDLDGPFPLDPPLTLSQLRDRADDVRAILAKLKAAHTGSLYFPFTFWVCLIALVATGERGRPGSRVSRIALVATVGSR